MISASIIGASGYTGAELVRLLLGHPKVKIVSLIAESNAGKSMAELYPHFSSETLPDLITLAQADFSNVDVVFCCLPHGTSQTIVAGLPESVKVIDLSADFRITDATVYEEWYGKPHEALSLQKEAVYGLTEVNREQVKEARLVACPGCYPTSILLPLIPLLKAHQIDADTIIVDAKTGVTGAGRSVKLSNLFTEVNDGVSAYGVAGHRHVAEIEQELTSAGNTNASVMFTPHLIPMSRGILSTLYLTSADGVSYNDIVNTLSSYYKSESFVQVHSDGYLPSTREVYGTNRCVMSLFEERINGKVTIVSVIDNLIKGASGQALQNMNLMFGFEETEGLSTIAVFP